ncbi:ATP-binding protein [Achromobacter insuavis]
MLDRGPGMLAVDLPRLFDRFWRAEPSRARHAGGSGLGLAIAAAISEAHQGAIEAANRPDGGFEIRLTLPQDGPRPLQAG